MEGWLTRLECDPTSKHPSGSLHELYRVKASGYQSRLRLISPPAANPSLGHERQSVDATVFRKNETQEFSFEFKLMRPVARSGHGAHRSGDDQGNAIVGNGWLVDVVCLGCPRKVATS